MATIFIQKDEVYRTRIEDITDPQQFFYPVYEQARDSLLELTQYTKQYWDEHTPPATYSEDPQEAWERKTKKTDLARPVINPMRLRGYPNNIIAFCADRGHGKTSAMLSFAKALKDSEKTEDKEKVFWQNKLQDYRFFALDPIDPTVLENTDHIIPTIISRMFAKFTKKAEKLHNSSRNSYGGYRGQDTRRDLRDQQQKLLKLFQNCYRLADEQKDSNKRSENYDDLQLLADRGDSSNFKVRFWELVWNYLMFMNLNEAGYPSADLQKTFLVIQIDDADMNPKHAYDVVEDLRKYCVLPNVVILFATNLEQLEMCVEQHFVKSFEPMIKLTVSNDADSLKSAADSRRHCHYTTASYLDKLIPSLHRVNLPDINHTLQNFGTPIYLWHEAFSETQDEKNPAEYQKALVEILRKRCLLPLQTEEGRLHPFLPRKMRELTHFLNRMSTLQEVGTRRELLRWAAGAAPQDYDNKRPYEMKRNLEFLMDYLVYDWCDLVLEPYHRRVIREIHRATTVRKIDVALEQLQPLIMGEVSKTSSSPTVTTPSCSVQCQSRQGVSQSFDQLLRQFGLPTDTVNSLKSEFSAFQNQPSQYKPEGFQHYGTQNNPGPTSDNVASAWSNLMNRIEKLRSQDKGLLACALELYFVIYKELLLVGTCIDHREGGSAKNVAGMSTLGNCDTPWYASYEKSPAATMGGFTFPLNQLPLEYVLVPSSTKKFALNTWLHVKNDEDNPDNKSIWDLRKDGSNVDVVFDPLRSSMLDWGTLKEFFDNSENAHYLDQVEIRLVLFANRSLQHKLKKELQKIESADPNDWSHFHQRMQRLWNTAGILCLGTTYVSDSSTDNLLDSIFLCNDNNRIGYLKGVAKIMDPKSILTLVLDNISTLLGKLTVALSLVSSQEESLNNLDLCVVTNDQVWKLWEGFWGASASIFDNLNTLQTNDLYSKLKDIHTDITSDETTSVFGISVGNVSADKVVPHIDKVNSEVEELKKMWKKHMGKNADPKPENYPAKQKEDVEMLVEKLDKWIENAKFAENAAPVSET